MKRLYVPLSIITILILSTVTVLKETDNPEYDRLIQRSIELEKGISLLQEERNRFRTENGDLKGAIYEMRVVYEGGPVYDWVKQD